MGGSLTFLFDGRGGRRVEDDAVGGQLPRQQGGDVGAGHAALDGVHVAVLDAHNVPENAQKTKNDADDDEHEGRSNLR